MLGRTKKTVRNNKVSLLSGCLCSWAPLYIIYFLLIHSLVFLFLLSPAEPEGPQFQMDI